MCYQCAGNKDHHLRTQSWSRGTTLFREERWMYKGAAVSTISSLKNENMATIAHWSHVEWQDLQSLFFRQAYAEASHLRKMYPQRPRRVCLPEQSHPSWETATPTCCQVPFRLLWKLLLPVKGKAATNNYRKKIHYNLWHKCTVLRSSNYFPT